MTVKIRIRHIFRLLRVIKILAKYGLADELASLGIKKNIRFFQRFFPKKTVAHIKSMTRWERMRFAVEEMGTTAIKFAQIISTRTDIIPPELIYEFEKLQNDVPPFDPDRVRDILREEWGGPPERFVRKIDPVPLAAASIAQVHRGELPDGTPVVIKVQRPEILDYIRLDIEILAFMAEKYMERYGEDSSVDMSEVVRNFEAGFLGELSFLNEAVNLTRFHHNFADDHSVKVPELYRELCTDKVLVMEFIDGIKITDIDRYEEIGCDPQTIAEVGLRAVFRQIFEFGYFHGDPHPGNIMVLPNNTICFIDFGMTGSILRSDLYSFSDILLGIKYGNSQKVLKGIKHLMVGKNIANERKLLIEIDDLIYLFGQLKPEEINLEYFFQRIRSVLHEQKIQMPGDFFVLTKAMVTIEGVGRKVYPDLDVLHELVPYLKGVFRDRYSPSKIWERVVTNASDFITLMETLPGDTHDILQNIKEITGKYDDVERNLARFSKDIKKTTAQIELAIILGIWLICSTILVAQKFPPLVGNWSVFGVFGYIVSIIAGYRLLRR